MMRFYANYPPWRERSKLFSGSWKADHIPVNGPQHSEWQGKRFALPFVFFEMLSSL
jgi:hypothetical protein